MYTFYYLLIVLTLLWISYVFAADEAIIGNYIFLYLSVIKESLIYNLSLENEYDN